MIGGAGRFSSWTIHRPVGVSTYWTDGFGSAAGSAFAAATGWTLTAAGLDLSFVAHPARIPNAEMPAMTNNILLILAPFCIYDLRLTIYDCPRRVQNPPRELNHKS
jgi:hypothetical protein